LQLIKDFFENCSGLESLVLLVKFFEVVLQFKRQQTLVLSIV